MGADTEVLSAFGRRVHNDAQRLDEVICTVVAEFGSVSWVGPDRDRAMESAHELLRRSGQVRSRLQNAAEEIENHAQEQNRASDQASGSSGDSSRWPAIIELAPSLFDAAGAGSEGIGFGVQNFLTFGDDEFDPLDWVLGTAEEAAGWTWDNIGVPVVNGLASFGQAMIDNPAATGTMLLGLGMMALGAAGEGVGIALLPTGLVTFGGGTGAGGVVMVGSAELIAAGAAVTAAGGGILFAEAVNNPQSPASPRQPETYQPAAGGSGAPRPAGEVLGEMPAGKSPGVRTVGSDAELQASYDQTARGGEVIRRPGYRGEWVRQPDGTEIGLRESSRSGGRTIDVRHSDGTTEKVHIR